MSISLTTRFERFLDEVQGSENIDVTRPQTDAEKARADYLVCNRRIVVEIKTLTDEQLHKGEEVLEDYLEDTGIKVFGTLPLARVARSDDHLASIEETIYRRMTRGIERVCRSANKQIGSEFVRLPHLATGLLVIVNQNLMGMHPRLVADRVVEFTKAKPTNIHFCLLIFESHRVHINDKLVPYPLLLDLTYSARQRRVKPFLKNIQQQWAKRSGFLLELPDPEPLHLDYYPSSITFGN